MSAQALQTSLAPWLPRIHDALVADAARVRAAVVGAPGSHGVVVDALADLLLRPAKRLRPALMVAVAEASGWGWNEASAHTAVALEWMQVYLLVHDDWMDHDEERRGGPSVPALMRAAYPEAFDAMSVLAGDLARAFADEALGRALAAGAHAHVVQVFASMHRDVVLGQITDVLGEARTTTEVERAYAHKTASYTTVGPVLLGLALAGRTNTQDAARAAACMGVAFQIHDDLQGMDRDAREGKHTWLVATGEAPAAAQGLAHARIKALVAEARALAPALMTHGAMHALCTYVGAEA